MEQNFDQIQGWVATHEGGYVNHPRDPGGATNKGVTQRVYDGYRTRMGNVTQSVRHISEHEAVDVYHTQYWLKVWAHELPTGLDYAVYDFGINSGPSRSIKFLQREIGVSADGVMGNVTLGKIREVAQNPYNLAKLIEDLCTARWNWMQTLSTFDTFGRGWTRRVMGEEIGAQDADTGVIDRAVKLSRGARVAAPTRSAEGKAVEEDTRPIVRLQQALTLDNVGKVVGGSAVPTAFMAASQQEGPMQYALSAGVLVAIIFAAVVAYKLLFSTRGENRLA